MFGWLHRLLFGKNGGKPKTKSSSGRRVPGQSTRTGTVGRSETQRQAYIQRESKKNRESGYGSKNTWHDRKTGTVKRTYGQKKTQVKKPEKKKKELSKFDAYKKRLQNSMNADKIAEDIKKLHERQNAANAEKAKKASSDAESKEIADARARNLRELDGIKKKGGILDPRYVEHINKQLEHVKSKNFDKAYKEEKKKAVAKAAKEDLNKRLTMIGAKGLPAQHEEHKKVTKEIKKEASKNKVRQLTTAEAIEAADPVKANLARTTGKSKNLYSDSLRKKMQTNTQAGLDRGDLGIGFMEGNMPVGSLLKSVEKQYGVKLDDSKAKNHLGYNIAEMAGYLSKSAAFGSMGKEEIAKALTKVITKKTGKEVLSKGGKFAVNRLADAGASTLVNVEDAVKNSKDSKDFIKNFGVNMALDAGLGSVIDGGGALKRVASLNKTKDARNIIQKVRVGESLTKAEKSNLKKEVARVAAKSKSGRELTPIQKMVAREIENGTAQKAIKAETVAKVNKMAPSTIGGDVSHSLELKNNSGTPSVEVPSEALRTTNIPPKANTPVSTSDNAFANASIDNIPENSQNINIEAKKADVSAKEVFKKAGSEQNRLNAMLLEISDKLGVKYEPSRQKSIESMQNKVARKTADGKSYGLMDMKDHARSKVEMKNFNQIPDVLSELEKRGIKYDVEVVSTDMGYKGFHVTYRNADGIGVEIQLTTPEAWKVKLESDKIYDKWRNKNVLKLSKEDLIQRETDIKRSIEMWNHLDIPDLTKLSTSSLDNGRAIINSPEENDLGSYHSLDSKSKTNSLPSSTNKDWSTNVPSSVNTNGDITNPPLKNDINIISKTDEKSKVSRRLTPEDDAEYLETNKGNETKRKTVKANARGEKVILHGDDETSNFISSAVKGKAGKNTVVYGKTNKKLSGEVASVNPNVDVSDYYLELVPDNVKHAYDNHSLPKENGDIELSEKDFVNIPEYIDTYDDLLNVKTDKNGKTTVQLGKKINGHAVIIEVVSKGRKSVQFKTMWGMKTDSYLKKYDINTKMKTEPVIGGDKSHSLELKNSSGTPSTEIPSSNNNSIPDSAQKSNIEAKKTAPRSVDNEIDQIYNNDKGGTKNGRTDVKGQGDLRETESGIRQQQGRINNDRAGNADGSRAEGLGRTRVGSGHDGVALLDRKTRQTMNDSGIADLKLRETSNDNAIFVESLESGRASNPHGSYVDGHDTKELTEKGTRTFLSEDNMAGIAVEKDGNITAAFKNSNSRTKGAVNDLIITARENGGTKMDCYGKHLVNMYEKNGYVPVARIPFNPEYVDDASLLKGKPDVYALMKNTDDLYSVIKKNANGSYHKSTLEELNKLPTFDDYDKALKYRDDLLAKQEAGKQGGGPGAPKIKKTNSDVMVDLENDPAVRDIIVGSKNKKESSGSIKENFIKMKDEFRQGFVDSLQGIEVTAKKIGGEAGEKLNHQANALRQAGEKANYSIMNKQTDFNMQVIGKGEMEILGPIMKRGEDTYHDFNAYLFHRLNIDRFKNGKSLWGEDVVLPEKSRQIVSQLDDKYGDFSESAEEVYQYYRNLNTVRVQAGTISAGKKDMLEEMYTNYVSAYRNISKSELEKTVDGSMKVNTGIRRAKGGDQAILPIHEQMAYATQQAWKSAELNQTIKTLAEMQGFEIKEITEKILKDGDVTDGSLDELLSHSVFFDDKKTGLHNAVYYVDGKAYETKIDDIVYRGLSNWKPSDTWEMFNNDIFKKADKGLTKVNNAFKALITTYNGFFALRNGARDLGDALWYAENGTDFIKNMPGAFNSMKNKDAYWQMWKASGGKYSGLLDITQALKPESTLKKIGKLRWIEAVNDAVEQYPRFIEFKSVLKKEMLAAGITDITKCTKEMIDRASHAGADITCNFGRVGSITKPINRTAVPFLNASIQGADKLWRVISGQKGARGYINLFMKLTAVGVAPGVAMEIMYANDEGYQDLNARDKDNYIFIKDNADAFWAIPRARGASVVTAPFQQLARQMLGNGDFSFDEFRQKLMTDLAPVSPFDANIFSQLINTFRGGDDTLSFDSPGKNWYGGNIESRADSKLSPIMRYNAKTTVFGKKASESMYKILEKYGGKDIAEKYTLSPKKIDYLMDSYTGIIGDIGKAATVLGSTKVWYHQLFDQNMKKDPVYSNHLSQDYYDKSDELNKYCNDDGSPKKGATIEQAARGQIFKNNNIALSNLRDLQNSIRMNKDMSRSERAKYDKELQVQINNIYRNGVNEKAIKVYDDFIKKNKDQYMSNEKLIKAAQQAYEKETHASVNAMDTIYKIGGLDEVIKNQSSYIDKSGDKNKLVFSNEKTINQILKKYRKNGGKDDDFYSVYREMTQSNKERGIGTNSAYGNLAAITIRTSGKAAKTKATLRDAFGVFKESQGIVNEYFKLGGSKKEYLQAAEVAESTAASLRQKNGDKYNYFAPFKARGLADKRLPDRAYRIVDSAESSRRTEYYINNSRGLKHYNVSAKTLQELDNKCAKNEKGYTTSEGLQKVLDKSNYNREEKALMWEALYGDSFKESNPYGSIGDYSLETDVGIDTSGGYKRYGYNRRGYRYGYRRYGHRGYGRSGRSGGSVEEKTEFEKYVESLMKSQQSGGIEEARMNYGSRKLNTKQYGSDQYRKAIVRLLAKKLMAK